MTMSELFRHFGELFEAYNYWSILLIAGVVISMIPLNILYKKVMKGRYERLAKVVAFISVYIVSAAFIAVFTAITKVYPFSVGYVIGSALALGFCSQVTWEMIKLIRDYGAKNFILWILAALERERLLSSFAEKYGIDKKIVKIIISNIQGVAYQGEEFELSIEQAAMFKEKLQVLIESKDIDGAFEEIIKLSK